MKRVSVGASAAWAVSLCAALAMLLAAVPLARANGAPVDVYLSYLPGVSNWGPQTATGKANVAVADGTVVLDAQGLPRLTGELYQVWLESRADRKLYAIGTFNADANGQAHFQALIDKLPYQEYRMVLITVESDPDPDPAASANHAIAGLFPNKVVIQATPGAPAPAGGQTARQAGQGGQPARPAYLPVTGTGGFAGSAAPLAGAALVLAGALARRLWRK